MNMSSWLITIAIGALVLAGGGYYYVSLRPRRLYKIAQRHINYGNYARAIGLLEKLSRAYPNHLVGAWRLANLYYDQEEYQRGLTILRELTLRDLPSEPTIAEVRHLLALTYKKLNQPQEALAEYNILIEINPRQIDYFLERGRLYYFEKKTLLAKADFAVVVRERPQLEEGHYYLGMTLLEMKDEEGAEASFNRALKIKPDHGQVLLALGSLCESRGKNREAVELLQRAIVADQEAAGAARVKLARSFCQLNEPLRAVQLLEEALLNEENDKTRALMKYELALGYDRLGEMSKARSCMREVYQTNPDIPGIREYLGNDTAILRDDDLLAHFLEMHVDEFEKKAYMIVESFGYTILRSQVYSFESLDVFAERPREIYNEKAIFNFRRWTHNIAELPIRELHRQILEEHAHRGFFVAPAQFTLGGIKEAVACRIDLINRGRLARYLRRPLR